MTVHMLRELDKLKKMILALSAMVEESVQQGVLALVKRDEPLAHKVVEMGDLEEECLKILALHQPVAADLRFIVAVLKINNDLERINDLAGNLASRSLELMSDVKIDPPFDVVEMSSAVEDILRKSLDALVNLDERLAWKAIQLDDGVDRLHKNSFDMVKAQIRKQPEHIDGLISYLSISRYLERIADLATNVAEDVIYLVDGRIVRHKNTA